METLKYNTNVKFVDGFDDAIVGIIETYENDERVIYDKEEIIQLLIERDEMDYNEANEYYENNILGKYYGEKAPIFLVKII